MRAFVFGGRGAKTVKMLIMVKASKKASKIGSFRSPPGSSRDTPDLPSAPDAAPAAQLNLADHFLIAMPSMLDPIFGGAVVYLCEHNADGALGVIINKPTDMTMDMLFERVELKLENVPGRAPIGDKPVLFGGPVQVERGFVLHMPHGAYQSMMKVTDEIALTTSKDVLETVAAGNGPQRLLVTLGCSGWSAGQLEEEIARNGWLTVRADPAIIFDLPLQERFTAAMKLLGIDPTTLAGDAGHA